MLLLLAQGIAVVATVAVPLALGRFVWARREAARGIFALGAVAGLFAAAGVVLLGRASASAFAAGLLPAPSPDRAALVGAVLRALAVVVAEGLARRWALGRAGHDAPAPLLGLGFGAAQAALTGLFAFAVMALALALRDGTQGDLVALGFGEATAPRVALKLDAWWNTPPSAPLLEAGRALAGVCLDVGLVLVAARRLRRGASPWLAAAALQLPFALLEELARALAPNLERGELVLTVSYGVLGLAGLCMARSASGRPSR